MDKWWDTMPPEEKMERLRELLKETNEDLEKLTKRVAMMWERIRIREAKNAPH